MHGVAELVCTVTSALYRTDQIMVAKRYFLCIHVLSVSALDMLVRLQVCSILLTVVCKAIVSEAPLRLNDDYLLF